MSTGRLEGLPTLAQLLGELQILEREGRLRGGAASTKGGGRFRFSKGLQVSRLDWPGVGSFFLNRDQLAVVTVLLDAYFESSNPDVGQKHLLAAIGSSAATLSAVFVESEAWGQLVIAGRSAGSYRIAPPRGKGFAADDEGEEGETRTEWIDFE